MNYRMDIPKNRLAAFIASVETALLGTKVGDDDHFKLVELAVEEASDALVEGNFELPFGDVPECIGRLIKIIRLSGEMPLYISKIAALWLKKNDEATTETVKERAEINFGLHFEREALQLIAEAFAALPDIGLDEKSLEKADIITQAHRFGYENEKVYRGCAQCMVATISDLCARPCDDVFRAASGFAGGIGGMGDGVCGGYSGGIMSLGLFAGRRREFFDGDAEEKELGSLLAQKLREKFVQTYGSVICHEIHKEIFGRAFNINLPEEKEAFEEAGAHSMDKCTAVVGAASAWVAEILFDHGFLSQNAGN